MLRRLKHAMPFCGLSTKASLVLGYTTGEQRRLLVLILTTAGVCGAVAPNFDEWRPAAASWMACVMQEVQGVASAWHLRARGFRAQGKHSQERQMLPPGKYAASRTRTAVTRWNPLQVGSLPDPWVPQFVDTGFICFSLGALVSRPERMPRLLSACC